MYCPDCRAEYREGFDRCEDCGVALVAGSPPAPGADEALVQVFETADASLVPVIRSVLESAEIPFSIQGEEASALFPLGSLGGGRDDRELGIVVHVLESRAQEARAVLEALPAADGELPAEDDPAEPVDPGEATEP